MKRAIDSKRYTHKAANSNSNCNNNDSNTNFVHFAFLYSRNVCVFSLFYLPGLVERVWLWVVLWCVCFASYLMVMVGVRAALYAVDIYMCVMRLTLPVLCTPVHSAIHSFSFLFSRYVPFSVMHCVYNIQTRHSKHSHENRLRFCWMDGWALICV